MLSAIVLDTSPLSLVTQEESKPSAIAIRQWMKDCIQHGATFYIPEVADYEVRREMIRAGKTNSITRLDELLELTEYLPITTNDMRDAAQMWAEVRNAGQPTADNHALDGDVILCAQALNLGVDPAEVVVATSNPKHISRFLSAADWQNIKI